MKAEIMGIGTELLMGELNDTNAGWIATRLPPLGITLQWVTLVGDDLGQLTHAFEKGLERSDVIFTTGGLGPTQDDLTREAVAAAFGETPRSRRHRSTTCDSTSATAARTCLPTTSSRPG